MSISQNNIAQFKQQAAEHAASFVESGMVVGLGHGSTAIFAIHRIGHMLKTGELKNIVGVPCSRYVEEEARQLGIPVTTLHSCLTIDMTIDGADEVNSDLNLIKGGGGALLREKIVAQASHREIIVVDESKLVPLLGTRWSVPVEVLHFGWCSQAAYLESLGAETELRYTSNGDIFSTDQGNVILDCQFGPIPQPVELAAQMNARAGIVEHGLFIGLVSDVIVAGPSGLQHLQRQL